MSFKIPGWIMGDLREFLYKFSPKLELKEQLAG